MLTTVSCVCVCVCFLFFPFLPFIIFFFFFLNQCAFSYVNNYMSRNSHGVILQFWMGERLIVTFGRQVYGQILAHSISCPFCMAVASLWTSCIPQGRTEGLLAQAVGLTHVALSDVSHCEWLQTGRPGLLLSCKNRHLHRAGSSSPCMPFFLPELTYTLCLALGGPLSPLISEAAY